MNKTGISNYLRPIIIFFILINTLCLTCDQWLDAKNIDHDVLIVANLILFILTLTACFIHIKTVKNSNPYAFVRGVTLASVLKLLIIATSVIVYLMNAETKSIYAVICAMALYIVYTIFEVKGAMKINRERNAKN